MKNNIDLLTDYSVHILTLAKNADKQASHHSVEVPTSLVENIDKLECTLNYPLKYEHTFEIPLEKYNWRDGKTTLIDVDAICVAIAKEYQMLWRKHNSWFWGHHWGDLYIELIEMNPDYKLLGVAVGS